MEVRAQVRGGGGRRRWQKAVVWYEGECVGRLGRAQCLRGMGIAGARKTAVAGAFRKQDGRDQGK